MNAPKCPNLLREVPKVHRSAVKELVDQFAHAIQQAQSVTPRDPDLVDAVGAVRQKLNALLEAALGAEWADTYESAFEEVAPLYAQAKDVEYVAPQPPSRRFPGSREYPKVGEHNGKARVIRFS